MVQTDNGGNKHSNKVFNRIILNGLKNKNICERFVSDTVGKKRNLNLDNFEKTALKRKHNHYW